MLKRLKNAKRRDLFEREIRAVDTLRSVNILRIEDFNLSPLTSAYYVAEYCEQGSLAEVGAESFKGDMSVSESVLLPIIDALGAAHNLGIVHRDLKPCPEEDGFDTSTFKIENPISKAVKPDKTIPER